LLTSQDQLANPTIRFYVYGSETVALRSATGRGQGNEVSSPGRTGEQQNADSSVQAPSGKYRVLSISWRKPDTQ
jgi:hypothetical protein